MNETAISWTNKTWNFVTGCSKISDGCRYCYAAALSERFGWTKTPWTIQNEAENIRLKPHKLAEIYAERKPVRVFVNSMSDAFHRQIPDWFIAAAFNVMLDNPQHTFQILTKRPEAAVDWHARYLAAVETPEYKFFVNTMPNPKVVSALARRHATPWAPHIWIGATVEDERVIGRVAALQATPAQVRFISAEPLLGPWPETTDLAGIHWVIIGGESGQHMTSPNNPRWMRQEWARGVRDLALKANAAVFYKQDSGVRTELRPYLVEADGSKWVWQQYPGPNRLPPYLFGSEPPAEVSPGQLALL
jgi:protein gp37